MITTAILFFIIGYLFIAFEHSVHVNKAASALITGIMCWTLYMFFTPDKEAAVGQLIHHLGDISSILFFLLGAMTIVELIDTHGGFSVITDKIKTRSVSRLLWIVGVVTFFLSALLDNLTTAIVMTSLCRKLLSRKEDRLWFAGIIVITANAGGAFSPLGDVTTTMLWIGGQISAMKVIAMLLVPSIFVALIPVFLVSRKFSNKQFNYLPKVSEGVNKAEALRVLIFGIILLLFVPVFKTVTHLPPFMGVLLSVGILWVYTSVIHRTEPAERKEKLSVTHALQKIDSPSILFFLGILLAVSALESFGVLGQLAGLLNASIGNDYMIGTALGLISALVDNVPLVAAAQGMYSLDQYPLDHPFWHFLALSTGTGGSAIIIGSAAGVAAMGIENIDFVWYLKRISWLALVGFSAGIVIFLVQNYLV